MSAFRVLDQAPQFFSADGTALLVGGSVTFYESGTSTLANTYTDPTLVTPNSNPLLINSQGRISDVWGNTNYRMVVADASGNILWTRDNVQASANSAQSIPALVSGDFLTTDGTSLIWQTIEQVPSMTGQSGNYLSNNGTVPLWVTPASNASVAVSSDSFQSGASSTTSNYLVQFGSGTAAASGSPNTNVTITFPTAFTTCLHVSITRTTTVTGQVIVSNFSAAPSASGFNVIFSVAEIPGGGLNNINNDITFTWSAHGFITP